MDARINDALMAIVTRAGLSGKTALESMQLAQAALTLAQVQLVLNQCYGPDQAGMSTLTTE